jgi:hypothetical protein
MFCPALNVCKTVRVPSFNIENISRLPMTIFQLFPDAGPPSAFTGNESSSMGPAWSAKKGALTITAAKKTAIKIPRMD